MCASPLPVGLAGYMASALAHQTRSSPPSKHHAHSDTPDPKPLGSQASSPGTLAAASDNPVTGATRRSQQEEERRDGMQQLGTHANAAWHDTPELSGCGLLLPSWRQIADLLVPLLHRVGYDPLGLLGGSTPA